MENHDDKQLFDNAGLALLTCVSHNDIENVKLLLDKGAPIFYQDSDSGWTALHFATDMQNIELVKVLIENGATWNAIDLAGYTPADIALSYGWSEGYEEIDGEGVRAEFLLDLLGKQAENDESDPASNLQSFLSSKLRYEIDDQGQERVVDSQDNPVMMAWETPIS